LLDRLRVGEQDLLQLVGAPGRELVQFEDFHPTLFAEDLAEIEQPELGHDDGGLEKRMFPSVLHGEAGNPHKVQMASIQAMLAVRLDIC
jgi:hypothetical protein